jgi:hypothetical protein
MNANQRVEASRGEETDDLAPRGAADRISLRTVPIKRNITPNGPGIWRMSDNQA